MRPIVVILPVYNGKPYLHLSVESVLSQDYSDFEFLILDDCSTDGSFEYLQSLSDPRIKLYRNPKNRGLFPNLNFLIERSDAPLIKIWSQDDIMHRNCLAEVVAFHQRFVNLGFSYSNRDLIDETGRISRVMPPDNTPEIISTQLHSRIAYFTGSIAGNIANVCLVRVALQKSGLFDESMKISGDFFMWVRLARYFETGFINKPLIQLRDHAGQLSRKESYYAHHVVEDLVVYRYLDSYSTEAEKRLGHNYMEQHKLLFYYTIMIKACFKFHFKVARDIRSALVGYADMNRLRKNFILFKLLKKKPIPLSIKLS